jgi:hypothetical protein
MDKELFNQDLTTNPDGYMRFAIGDPTVDTQNITWDQIVELLYNYYSDLDHTHNYALPSELPTAAPITWDLASKHANLTVSQNAGSIYGRVVSLHIIVRSSTNDNGVVRKIGDINAWRPNYVYAPGANITNYGHQNVPYCYIDNGGGVYVSCPHANDDYIFNPSFVIPMP